MSTDPQKTRSKKWDSFIASVQRRRGVRELQTRFLVVCEDDVSAPNYFLALKKHENLTATSVEVVGSKHKSQPIQVVDRAIELMKLANHEDSGTEPFEQIWCVVDGEHSYKLNNARSRACANGVKLAVSTMCFEYWVLLHFDEHAKSALNCDAVVSTLKKHQPNYTKGGCDFTDIVPHARTASERAKRLRDRSVHPENQNPCSEVYLLIDAILGSVAPSSTNQSPSGSGSPPKREKT
jgi:hypothetical protein